MGMELETKIRVLFESSKIYAYIADLPKSGPLGVMRVYSTDELRNITPSHALVDIA
jgi:hypothetical protein